MGCTSSAPNMVDSQTDTTDNLENNMVLTEETNKNIKEKELNSNGHQDFNKNQVLPECEIKNNKKQLASNNNGPTPDADNSCDVNNKDNQAPPHITNEDIDNTVNNTEFSQADENIISLKEVVEKVISEKTEEEDHKIYTVEEVHDVDRQIEDIMELKDSDEGKELKPKDEDTSESTSPTQSEDSRATRWEALADIAAELPPSLAVDPLTGQIYSLTK